MPWTKEETKEYNRLYKLNTKEKTKEYNRLYNLNNTEKNKEYRIQHKDKVTERNRLYYLKNKEKITEQKKEYNQTEQGKKTKRISNWKGQGILCFDWNLLYDLFISTTKCEFCKIELTIDKKPTSTTRCLDHDHSITDKFNVRAVLCNCCNLKDVLK